MPTPTPMATERPSDRGSGVRSAARHGWDHASAGSLRSDRAPPHRPSAPPGPSPCSLVLVTGPRRRRLQRRRRRRRRAGRPVPRRGARRRPRRRGGRLPRARGSGRRPPPTRRPIPGPTTAPSWWWPTVRPTGGSTWSLTTASSRSVWCSTGSLRLPRDEDTDEIVSCERTDAVVDGPGVVDARTLDDLDLVVGRPARRLHLPVAHRSRRRGRGPVPGHPSARGTRRSGPRRGRHALPVGRGRAAARRAGRASRSKRPSTRPRSPTTPSSDPTRRATASLGPVDEPEFWRWMWLGAAVVFGLGEMTSPGSFFLAPFALGAAVAAVLSFLGVPVGVSWLAFIVVSLGGPSPPCVPSPAGSTGRRKPHRRRGSPSRRRAGHRPRRGPRRPRRGRSDPRRSRGVAGAVRPRRHHPRPHPSSPSPRCKGTRVVVLPMGHSLPTLPSERSH